MSMRPTPLRPTRLRACLPVLLAACMLDVTDAKRKKTRHDGQEPGWRPDMPTETSSQIVERMLRRLRSKAVQPGSFFQAYQKSWQAMADAHEVMRPATLKSADDVTNVDEEMSAKLRAAEAALRWQQAQVELLEGVAADDDVSQWPAEDMERLLKNAAILQDPADLQRLPVAKLAKDFAGVLRIFQYTFANMPDDEEAIEISHADNVKAGYPPPSQAPLMPPPPPDVAQGGGDRTTQQRRGGGKRHRDEL